MFTWERSVNAVTGGPPDTVSDSPVPAMAAITRIGSRASGAMPSPSSAAFEFLPPGR
jgi:hypothetical protein